jgi:hypothetical protein
VHLVGQELLLNFFHRGGQAFAHSASFPILDLFFDVGFFHKATQEIRDVAQLLCQKEVLYLQLWFCHRGGQLAFYLIEFGTGLKADKLFDEIFSRLVLVGFFRHY